MSLRDHAQQHLEQFDDRRFIGRGLRAHVVQQVLWIALEPVRPATFPRQACR
jgi:hypothetical protein